MKLVYCLTCKNNHFDHYECSKCGCHDFGLKNFQTNIRFNYCPMCGHKLNWNVVDVMNKEEK